MSSNLVKKMAIHHLFLLFDTLGILPFFVLPTLSFSVAALANQDAVVRIAAVSVLALIACGELQLTKASMHMHKTSLRSHVALVWVV